MRNCLNFLYLNTEAQSFNMSEHPVASVPLCLCVQDIHSKAPVLPFLIGAYTEIAVSLPVKLSLP